MHYFIRLICPVILLWTIGIFGSVSTLTDEGVVANLGIQAEILEDTTRQLNIYQVTSVENGIEFSASRKASPNLGYTQLPVWVRFKVKNLTFSNSWVLEAGFSGMDIVELYTGDSSDWIVQELGQTLPFYSRSIINRNLLFQIHLPFGQEKTFYLRYQNTGGIVLPLKLYASQQYQTHAQKEQFVFGIFFGFMLVLSLYNLTLYVKVRETEYLYYFLYITCIGLFQFSLYGLAYQYLWPAGGWWSRNNVSLLLACALFFRLLFTISILDSNQRTSRSHTIWKGLGTAFVLLAGYLGMIVAEIIPRSLTPGPQAIFMGSLIYFSISTVVIFFFHFRCIEKRMIAAKTFMVAWSFMVSGLLLYGLKLIGVVPSNLFSENAILLGSIGEMCLLFVSVGERIQAIRTKAQAENQRQQEAIHAFQGEQIRSMRLELELLKANIHPHFMLNSINAAIMWIKEDPATAEKLLHALSKEFKQLLKIVGEREIPINDEIRICQMHLEVMSLRHDKKFSMRLEGIQKHESIPPLVFHTLVENGLTHGFIGQDEGLFVLRRSERDGWIQFSLFNDGSEIKNSGESNGLGMKYVRARLKEAYGSQWRLQSQAVKGGWLVVIEIQKGFSSQIPNLEMHQTVLLTQN